jgi:acyl-CoA hydrolase
MIQRINKTLSWFFEKINKIDTPRGQRNSIQINKIRNGKGDITTETEKIKKKKKSDPTTKAYTQRNWSV